MLTELTISNFALIDQLEVNFSKGMTSITGETGAGKSILLGGLALVLGKRADLTTLKDKSKKCFVDATFSIGAYTLQDFFRANDLDYASITSIRREIIPSGKSRAFVNDTPVTLDILHQLGVRLIDIHSQHQTRSLIEESHQLDVLDALAGNTEVLGSYQQLLAKFRETNKAIEALVAQKNDLESERDYNGFLLSELQNAPLNEGILETLEEEVQKLSHVEELELHLSESLQRIEEEQMGVSTQLTHIRNALQKVASIGPQYAQLFDRFESLLIELNDASLDLSNSLDAVEANPTRLEEINTQWQVLTDLLKKHNAQTITQLIEKRDELDQKVLQTDTLDERLRSLNEQSNRMESELMQLSTRLTDNRKQAIPSFVDQLVKLLSLLGMPNARFQLELIPSETFLLQGREKLQFSFSANRGTNFGPLKKVASGGELSRIMLSIKAILSQFKTLPTIIFDEIDTGISGEVAYKIAEIMHHMGNYMQVMTITHLPQVAAKGAHHFKVYKETKNDSTFTQLRKLSSEQRVEEVAQMLSGDVLSDTAMQHAKELLN